MGHDVAYAKGQVARQTEIAAWTLRLEVKAGFGQLMPDSSAPQEYGRLQFYLDLWLQPEPDQAVRLASPSVRKTS